MSMRTIYLTGFVLVSLLLLASLYLQVFDGLIPCPLCILQRFTFGILGFLFLCGFLFFRSLPIRQVTTVLLILTSLIGMLIAGRQSWIQHFPPDSGTSCGASLEYMLQMLPMTEVMKTIFTGTAECTQRGWEFLYLTLAEWAFLWFSGFAMLSTWLLQRSRRIT